MEHETSAEAEVQLRHERAWAAGFFDGEGWAAAVKNRNRRQPAAMINQAGGDGVPQVLTRFLTSVEGAGRITGPVVEPGRQDLYRWTASSRRNVAKTYELIGPWLGLVKREQFERALGDDAQGSAVADWTQARLSPTDEFAWAAGFWDGEGWVGLERHQSHSGYFVIAADVKQAGSQLPEVLKRFADAVGAGRIYGPIKRDGHQDAYRWRLGGTDAVERVVRTLWPWLGEVKRDQARRALEVVRGQAPLSRGNPAWGSHKTHCIHGHAYASARVRPYASRGVGRQRRDSKQCLACTREQARARGQTRGG